MAGEIYGTVVFATKRNMDVLANAFVSKAVFLDLGRPPQESSINLKGSRVLSRSAM